MALSETSGRCAYETYSLFGVTDPNAPVKASGEIVVKASRQQVWQVLCDVRSWPRLRPDIETVDVEGEVTTGTSCILTTAGVKLVVTFGLMAPARELNWVTATPGLVMTNRYVLVPEGQGTRIVSHETITAPSYPQFTQDVLTERIETWLAAVKAAAEAQFVALPSVIQNYLAAYNRMDIPAMLECLGAAVRFENISNHGESTRTEGREQFASIARQSAAMFSTRNQSVVNYVADGDRVALEICWTGETRGDPQNSGSGERLLMRGASFITVSNGKIARIVDIS